MSTGLDGRDGLDRRERQVGLVGQVRRVGLVGRVGATGLLIAALASGVYAGGWAVITVKNLPDYAVAGKPLMLTFLVRQHGVTLLNGLTPKVHATHATRTDVDADAQPTTGTGEYVAILTLAQPGDWTVTIDSGFLSSATTLPVVKVISAAAPSPAPLPASVRGERLFVAKGCITCHLHEDITPEPTAFASIDLTGKRFSPEYLGRFLANPSIKPPSKSHWPDQMPNLNLEREEIAALIAFLDKH